MILPGFTAENSLYKSSGLYRTSGTMDQGRAVISPAQMNRSARGPGFKNTVACIPGTWCVTDPNNPSCRTCTYIDENCIEGLSYHECDPVKPKCAPVTLYCNPDPLDRFCNICYDLDADCQLTTHHECFGVPIPNKVTVPEPGKRNFMG